MAVLSSVKVIRLQSRFVDTWHYIAEEFNSFYLFFFIHERHICSFFLSVSVASLTTSATSSSSSTTSYFESLRVRSSVWSGDATTTVCLPADMFTVIVNLHCTRLSTTAATQRGSVLYRSLQVLLLRCLDFYMLFIIGKSYVTAMVVSSIAASARILKLKVMISFFFYLGYFFVFVGSPIIRVYLMFF